jgi:Protein of unknown function (DUF3618)
MSTPNESPERIEDEIRDTRREIDRTLDALQSKLSPGQLLDQALAYVKNGGGEFTTNLGRTISRNPVPVALVGVGLTWLMCSRQGTAPAEGNGLGRRRSNGDYGAAGDLMGENRNYYRNYYSDSSSAGVGEAVQSGAARVREGVRDARDTAAGYAHTVGGAANEVADRAGEYAQAAWERSVHAKDSAAQTLQEYPVLIGVLGLAAGALAAAFLPPTRREDELMGAAADQLKRSTTEAVKETVHEAADAVQTAAERAPQEPNAGVDDDPQQPESR